LAMAINFFRGSINHGYAHRGPAVGLEAMLLDSINVTRPSVWGRVWSPLNTRYHALHHLYPSLPYHALPEAHDRLMAALPAGHPYRRVNQPTYPRAFGALIWPRRGPRPEGP
jgi:fatty acid desaturase